MKKLIFFSVILLALTSIDRTLAESSSLQILWSDDIPDGRSPKDGIVLQDISQGSDGTVIGLARKGGGRTRYSSQRVGAWKNNKIGY